jgi:hypothetical protein
VKMVICALGWLDALVFHVLSARLCVVFVCGRRQDGARTAPRSEDAGQVVAGVSNGWQ